MSRRLTAALLWTALLALPAAAAAQTTAPDEHAAARAFAAVGLRATAEIQSAGEAWESRYAAEPKPCRSDRRLRRGPARAQAAIAELYAAHMIADLMRAVTPALQRATTELNAVPTADPALRGGRAAWRGVTRVYARVGALEPVRLCSVVRDFVRNDYRATGAMKRARRVFRAMTTWDTTTIDQRMAAAVERLIALGIPEAEADAFDGEVQSDYASREAAVAAAAR